MTTTREKRSFTRISVDIPGSISFYQMDTYHTGSITNISLSGCLFPFEGELPVGEPCDIAITVGEGMEAEQITVVGVVVRSDSRGVGINFTDNSPECTRQLEKIIAHEAAK